MWRYYLVAVPRLALQYAMETLFWLHLLHMHTHTHTHTLLPMEELTIVRDAVGDQ